MLSSKYRIPKNQILQVIRKGAKISAKDFDIRIWWDENIEHSMFAFVVSTKVDKRAVVRNRIKRIFRAAVYKMLKEGKLRKGNYVFLIRNAEIKNMKSYDIEKLIQNVM